MMHEQITENIYFTRGYDKGFSDAQEHLAKDFDKAYERGFKDGFLKFKQELKPKKKKKKKNES